MRWLLLLILLTCQVASAGPLDDRLNLEFRADYSPAFEGWTKVREWDKEGEHLDLADDLGVDQWFSFSFEAAWRFDHMHGLRAAFTWNQFRGGKTFDHDLWHDGALFAAGTTIDFGPTRWWRAELWYELTPWRSEWGAFTLLAGVTVDDLNVFLEPNKPRLSNKQATTRPSSRWPPSCGACTRGWRWWCREGEGAARRLYAPAARAVRG